LHSANSRSAAISLRTICSGLLADAELEKDALREIAKGKF
jgi:hypothetical protein